MRTTLGLIAAITLLGPGPAVADTGSMELVLALEEVFVQVAEQATPWVVTLEVHGSKETSSPFDRGGHIPFGGTGSGFVVDGEGTIFTNFHVVGEADRIEAVFADGRRFKADFVAGDLASDVAVIRMLEPPADLLYAPLGDSDAVRVGQFAIAIGAPLGFESSVTIGHVSAKGRRSIGNHGPGGVAPGFETLEYQDFLQVDTPINPGNSGGPLVDVHGRVIGINTAIASGGGGGLGFSIPINMARRIAADLLSGGKVRRGWLGVRMEDINPAEAEAFDLDQRWGARVTRVFEGTPAAAGKLQEDDVVISFNRKEIRNHTELKNAVAEAPIGEKVAVRVVRDNGSKAVKTLDLSVVLIEKPSAEEMEDRARQDERSTLRKGAGDYLFNRVGLELDSRKGGKGVVVRGVTAGSLAEDADLRPGDRLVEVNHKEVATAADVAEALEESGRSFVPLLVLRGGKERPMSLERPRG